MGLFDFLKKKELEEIRVLKGQLEKYSPISDIDKEVDKITKEFDELTTKQTDEINKVNKELVELNEKYENSLDTYKKLRKEVGLYESKLDLIEFGIYEPIYDFEHSDEYREEQKRIIELQKDMVKDETAAICSTNWTVDGSEAKGMASTKRNIKLVLRAFNGECNSLIAKVKWNNVSQMQERIRKSFEAINKLGKSSTISIEYDFLDLKIKELTLEHEFQTKKQREKEELREIQAQIREEEKVNMLNYRKEFFNVSLSEIENQINEIGIEAEFTRLPEAVEYRETLAILQKMNSTEPEKTIEEEIEEEFPSSLN